MKQNYWAESTHDKVQHKQRLTNKISYEECLKDLRHDCWWWVLLSSPYSIARTANKCIRDVEKPDNHNPAHSGNVGFVIEDIPPNLCKLGVCCLRMVAQVVDSIEIT